MTEKTCGFCDRTVEQMASEGIGVVNTSTNTRGIMICWECAKGAYDAMAAKAAALQSAAEKVLNDIRDGIDDNSGECQCPSCRIGRVLEGHGYECRDVSEADMTGATKH